MELTDLEICKRIAEIDSVKIDVLGSKAILDEMIGGVRIRLTEYNPLTDDALCFQLMVKYDIRVESFEPTLKDGSDGYEYHCYKQGALNYAINTLSISKSPNKAICLAIIEANKPS